jgi:hypothetical protein
MAPNRKAMLHKGGRVQKYAARTWHKYRRRRGIEYLHIVRSLFIPPIHDRVAISARAGEILRRESETGVSVFSSEPRLRHLRGDPPLWAFC